MTQPLPEALRPALIAWQRDQELQAYMSLARAEASGADAAVDEARMYRGEIEAWANIRAWLSGPGAAPLPEFVAWVQRQRAEYIKTNPYLDAEYFERLGQYCAYQAMLARLRIVWLNRQDHEDRMNFGVERMQWLAHGVWTQEW